MHAGADGIVMVVSSLERRPFGDAENARLENAGLENLGTGNVWNATCGIT